MSYKATDNILFLTSYPPRECGIATFTQDLIQSLAQQFSDSYQFKVCALEEEEYPPRTYPKEVVATLQAHNLEACAAMARKINQDASIKLVCIQHEFGLFGGAWGDHVMAFIYSLNKPFVLTLHTVLPEPSVELQKLMQNIASQAHQLVVMTQRSADLLHTDYGIPPSHVQVIPHGTHLSPWKDPQALKEKYRLSSKKVLATFGLLSENKGIENAIEALVEIRKQIPDVVYLVLGRTHPVVAAQEGERYRQMLEEKVAAYGLQDCVRFVNKYLELEELLDYLCLTDVYLFVSKDPYQAVSGTFTYALSSACPIISTPIPHAQEMLQHDMGVLLKDFNKPDQIAEAAIKLLSDEALRQQMSHNAYYHTRNAIWQNVAVAYAQLFHRVTGSASALHYNLLPLNLDHIRKLTTPFGIIQFSDFGLPNLDSGYTLDDNARALIAMCMYYEATRDARSLELIEKYLNFVIYCQQPDGNFLNYVDQHKKFTLQNQDVNLEDAAMRAVWALGTVISHHRLLPARLVLKAKHSFRQSLEAVRAIDSPRARAFAIKGLYCYDRVEQDLVVRQILDELARGLLDKYNGVATPEWRWFEEYLTYANSVLSEAMLYAYLATGRKEYRKTAKQSFDFLLRYLFLEDHRIKLISNRGWLLKGAVREDGGEQSIDVCYTITTLSLFYETTGKPSYREKLNAAFNWYLGNNHLNQIIYNPVTGGCFDGLEENHVNQNQGAESTVCYLIARLQVALQQQWEQTYTPYSIMVGREYSVTRENVIKQSVA